MRYSAGGMTPVDVEGDHLAMRLSLTGENPGRDP